MKKEDVKKELIEFKTAVEKDAAEINVMLVDQNNQRKKRYNGLMLKTKNEDLKSVLIDSLTYLIEELEKRTLDKYDLEISIDESIQMVDKKNVIHGEEILNEITVDYTKDNVVSENTDLSKVKFMVFQIYVKNKSLYLFKRYVQPSTAYKKCEKFVFNGGILQPFTAEVITINYLVDAILLGEKYYVFNRNTFNSIFAYKDVFAKIINDNKDVILRSGLLTDSEKFVSDCESDGRYLTKLTKVILAKGFEEVSKKKKEIRSVIKEFNLSLQTSKKGEIVYRGKGDIPEIMNLLLSHYVIDALTSNKMIAAAIQEYQIGKKGDTDK